MFQLTYGLFLAGTSWEEQKSACVINTAIQVTSTPNRMSVTMLKTNATTQMILKKKSLALSVISRETTLDTISDFGLRSSRDFDKFKGITYQTDEKGNPYLSDTMLCYMSLSVFEKIDLGTHVMFLCDVTEAENFRKGTPMTYADYRVLKNGGTLSGLQQPNKETETKKQYVCSVCHYVYDGDVPFEELPDDYVCPICKQPKSVFVAE